MRLRFGWTDEHLAVIPRKKALVSCGKNKTGVVTWRAAVTQKFDVFCFNETGRRPSNRYSSPQHFVLKCRSLSKPQQRGSPWNFKHFGASCLSNLSCTDAAVQMRPTTTDSPSSSSDYSRQTDSPSTAAGPTRTVPSSSSVTPFPSSSPSRVDSELESALFVRSTAVSFGGLCTNAEEEFILHKQTTH